MVRVWPHEILCWKPYFYLNRLHGPLVLYKHINLLIEKRSREKSWLQRREKVVRMDIGVKMLKYCSFKQFVNWVKHWNWALIAWQISITIFENMRLLFHMSWTPHVVVSYCLKRKQRGKDSSCRLEIMTRVRVVKVYCYFL